MKEIKDIILAYEKAVLQQKKAVLASVVQVDGSSYRRPGARMLVTEDGAITGAISGGCLEGDALRKAQLAMRLQQNRLEIYDTTDEEDHKLGVQLGCNGIVYILFEPIWETAENNPIQLLKRALQDRREAILVTIFNRDKAAQQIGTIGWVHKDETSTLAETYLRNDVQITFQHKRSSIKAYPEHSVLYQFVPPTLQLIIVGAGNDAQPLMDMAFLLGWTIIVVDGRPAYATAQRFPKAKQVFVVKPPELLSTLSIDEQTAVVLMTHNYNYDIAALEQFIQTACPYIGLLGPKKKLHKMLDELKEKGLEITESLYPSIYGPVGLDIGAETSEEIALSIMAEIKAVFSGRPGASLKDRPLEIHERSMHLQA